MLKECPLIGYPEELHEPINWSWVTSIKVLEIHITSNPDPTLEGRWWQNTIVALGLMTSHNTTWPEYIAPALTCDKISVSSNFWVRKRGIWFNLQYFLQLLWFLLQFHVLLCWNGSFYWTMDILNSEHWNFCLCCILQEHLTVDWQGVQQPSFCKLSLYLFSHSCYT